MKTNKRSTKKTKVPGSTPNLRRIGIIKKHRDLLSKIRMAKAKRDKAERIVARAISVEIGRLGITKTKLSAASGIARPVVHMQLDGYRSDITKRKVTINEKLVSGFLRIVEGMVSDDGNHEEKVSGPDNHLDDGLPPHTIYLQWFGDSDDTTSPIQNGVCGEVTWSLGRIFDGDVEYVKASDVREAMGGLPDSELFGEGGLIASVMDRAQRGDDIMTALRKGRNNKTIQDRSTSNQNAPTP